MLVLSRKSGETIRIGDNIVVTVTELRGGRVKIGIQAPDNCTIRRGELPSWTTEEEVATVQPDQLRTRSTRASQEFPRPKLAPQTEPSTAPLRKARLSLPGVSLSNNFVIH